MQCFLFHFSVHDQYAVVTYVIDYVMKDEQQMTQILKDILFKTQHLSFIEQLNALKEGWLNFRQVGASEAVYRLFSGLHLNASNITTTFVATGYPENRSVFFKKVTDQGQKFEDVNKSFDEDDLEEEDDEIIDNEEDGSGGIKIAGREGRFKPGITVHERYAQRPKYLEKMCLGQFATVYMLTSRVRKDTVWSEENKNCSELLSHLELFNEVGTCLPQYIDLREFNLGIMRARSSPCVLRTHSSLRKEGDEQYYAELLLYLPWRDENTLRPKDEDLTCMHLYSDEKNKKIIVANKEKLYAGHVLADILEEAQDLKIDKDKPTHVFDEIAAQNVQNEEDAEAEGIEDDPEFAGRNPGEELTEKASNQKVINEGSYFKPIVIPDDNDLLEMTRRMVPEQQFALKPVLKYCKSIIRNAKNPVFMPEAVKLIIHGGAGKFSKNICFHFLIINVFLFFTF